jgi:glycosyltransferase involved in cell wall biosynthesis
MKILIILPIIADGGMERVMLSLCNAFQEDGHVVTLLIGQYSGFYPLPENIQAIRNDILLKISTTRWNGLINNVRRITFIQKTIKNVQPDFVISPLSGTTITTIIASIGIKNHIIGMEHGNPQKSPISPLWQKFQRLFYPKLDALISVSKEVDQCFSWLPNDKRYVINNAVTSITDKQLSEPPLNIVLKKKSLIAMGRLSYEKGFDLLIDAYSLIASELQEYQLVIIGDGPEKTSLLRQISDKRLDETIILAGRLSNPFSTLKEAELFILPSRTEGFPMALLEALSLGIPAIAFDCPSGPNEIIIDGFNGRLVPTENIPKLAETIFSTLIDKEALAHLAINTRQSVESFTSQSITQQWNILLNRLENQ